MNKLENLINAIAFLERRLTEIAPDSEWRSSVQVQLEIRQNRLAKLVA